MRFFSRGHRPDSSTAHRYGTIPGVGRNTIHVSGHLDIEVDLVGRPTAVWFRCLNLPFEVFSRPDVVRVNPDDMDILNIEYDKKEV